MRKVTKEQVKGFIKENKNSIAFGAFCGCLAGAYLAGAKAGCKATANEFYKGTKGEIRMCLENFMRQSKGAYTHCTSDDNKLTIKQLGEIGNEMIEYMNTNLNLGLTPDTELAGAIFLTKK